MKVHNGVISNSKATTDTYKYPSIFNNLIVVLFIDDKHLHGFTYILCVHVVKYFMKIQHSMTLVELALCSIFINANNGHFNIFH